jgi:hypothetical protein
VSGSPTKNVAECFGLSTDPEDHDIVGGTGRLLLAVFDRLLALRGGPR